MEKQKTQYSHLINEKKKQNWRTDTIWSQLQNNSNEDTVVLAKQNKTKQKRRLDEWKITENLEINSYKYSLPIFG